MSEGSGLNHTDGSVGRFDTRVHTSLEQTEYVPH